MKKYPILFGALILAAFCAVLNLAFNQHIGSDTGNYYIRMADEFARGNYQAAFFHIVPPLSPFLAGLLAKTGMSGWVAMKLVSNLFFLASVYWTYRLARLRLTSEQAQWCAVLYVLCSRLLRYGMGGQLEAAKMFLMLLVFEQLLVYLDKRHWKHLLIVSVGTACLALARNEGIGYIPLVLGVFFFSDWIPPAKGIGFFRSAAGGIVRCMVVAGICLAVWSPWIAYQHHITGYAVLSSKHIAIVGKLLPGLDVENSDYMKERMHKAEELQQYALPAEAPEGGSGLVDWFENAQPCTTPFKLKETYYGIYPRYLIFALIGIVCLVRSRNWCRMDSLLAALFTYHVVVYWLLSPNILQRLIVPGIPLYFPWMVIGGMALFKWIKFDGTLKLHRNILAVLALVLGLSQLSSGMSSVRKTLRGKDRVEIEIAEWVRKNRGDLNTHKAPPLKSGLYALAYHTGHQPVVFSDLSIACRAESDAVYQQPVPGASHDQLVAILERGGLDLIVMDKKLKGLFLNLNPAGDPRFSIASDQWKNDGVMIYSFHPDAAH